MKYLMLLFLFSFSVCTFAQTTWDFETTAQDTGWTVFTASADTFSVVANPDMSGLNTSAHVAKFTIANVTGANPWEGVFNTHVTPFVVTAENCKPTLLVYKDTTTRVDFKIEGAGWNSGDTFDSVTVKNQWVKVSYDFTKWIGKTVTTITVIPDFGLESTRNYGSVSYFDDIEFVHPQVVNLWDFETTAQDTGWTVFTASADTFSVVANPDKSGLDTTAHVVKFTVDKSGAPWEGVFNNKITPFVVTADNCKPTLLVYKDTTSRVDFKYEGKGWSSGDTFDSNAVAHQWVKVSYDFSKYIGDTVTTITIIPDFASGSSRTYSSVNYFDQIELVHPVPQVVKLWDFESTAQDTGWTVFTPAADTFLVVTNPDISGLNTTAHVVKFTVDKSGAPWEGVFNNKITPFVVTADNCKPTLLVYKDTTSRVDFKYEGKGWSSGDTFDSNAVANQWVKVSYDFSAYIGDTVTTITIIPDFASGSSRTYSSVNYFDQIELVHTTTGVVETGVSKPSAFVLNQNYPNPFNPTTIISYFIPKSSFVSLKVYNILGQEVASLINNQEEAGPHQVNFNAMNLSSGVYIYSLRAGNFTATKKLMLLK